MIGGMDMKKRSLFIILFGLLITIAACDATEEESEREVAEEEGEEEERKVLGEGESKVSEIDLDIIHAQHPETDQSYTIIHAFDLYESYFSKVNNGMNEDEVDAIFKKEIMYPIYELCFADGEHIHMADLYMSDPPIDQFGIERIINHTEIEELNEAIFASLIESSDHLPTEEETVVCIFPSTDIEAPAMITVGAGKISVLYNDTHTEELIKMTIAHEYHHSIWTEREIENVQTSTLLDNLIFEGKAVMFSEIVYPDFNMIPPIIHSYDKEFWNLIEPDLHKGDFNRTIEVLMGGGDLPYAYGYSEGYKMVKSYLDKHPDLTPKDWLGTEAQVIFDEGAYLKLYE